MKNEKTSKRIARIAGKIEQEYPKARANGVVLCYRYSRGYVETAPFTLTDVASLAGSVLTQTADKKPFKSLAEVRNATKHLRRRTVDASTIPELGKTFADKPKRKAKKASRGQR